MDAHAIHAWLQGPGHYAEGLALLRACDGVDETDLWFLELGDTSVSRQQMREMLGAIHALHVRTAQVVQERAGQVLVTKAQQVATTERQERTVSSDGYGQVTNMPPAIKALHDQVREWAREMNYLRFPDRMEKLATDAERLRDALRVIELDQLITSGYSRIDTWRDTGRDPGEQSAGQKRNGAQLEKELQNIKTYLSRHRSGKRPSSQLKVAQWERQEKELQELIDALPT